MDFFYRVSPFLSGRMAIVALEPGSGGFMEIIRASVMGFCMGVRRAVEMAEKVSVEYRDCGCPMFTLGPLIHNPAVMDSLREKGVDVLDAENISDVKNGSPVVIRAHGAGLEIVDELKKRGAVVIDATCPRVRKSQKLVRDWSSRGYGVIVAGDGLVSQLAPMMRYINRLRSFNRSKKQNRWKFQKKSCFWHKRHSAWINTKA